MALYEIKEDCRIANKNYSKWDIVSNEEVGWYFPTVMKAIDWDTKKIAEEVIDDVKDEIVEEDVVEEKKPTKKWKKK